MSWRAFFTASPSRRPCAGLADALPDATRIAGYARAFTPDAVQLAYQICVQGRADMALAPDETTGFAMTLLRLLAFEPGAGPSAEAKPAVRAAARDTPGSGGRATSTSGEVASQAISPAVGAPTAPLVATAEAGPRAAAAEPLQIGDWPAFVAGLKLSGIGLQLAAQTELKAIAGNEIVLAVPEAARHLIDKAYTDKLKAALDEALGRRIRLRFDVDAAAGATLAAQEKRERAEAKAKTEAAFRDDPFVQDVLSRFDATIKTESIKPNS